MKISEELKLQMALEDCNFENKKALFFDVDGTLAYTEKAHEKAYELAFALNEVPFDLKLHRYYAPYGGKILMRETVINAGYEDKVDDIVKSKQDLLPYCLEKFMKPCVPLINLIKKQYTYYKIFAVTNGRKNSINKILLELGIISYFEEVITSDILGTLKPSPEPYNYALLQAGLKPEDVIVFEDNNIGFRAAEKAGIKDIIEVVFGEDDLK